MVLYLLLSLLSIPQHSTSSPSSPPKIFCLKCWNLLKTWLFHRWGFWREKLNRWCFLDGWLCQSLNFLQNVQSKQCDSSHSSWKKPRWAKRGEDNVMREWSMKTPWDTGRNKSHISEGQVRCARRTAAVCFNRFFHQDRSREWSFGAVQYERDLKSNLSQTFQV